MEDARSVAKEGDDRGIIEEEKRKEKRNKKF